MKKATPTLLLLYCLVGLSACKLPTMPEGDQIKQPIASSSPSPQQSQAFSSQALTLQYNQSLTIESEQLTLTFNELVQDSRCAVDVQCIRAGDTTVKVEVKQKETILGVGELTFQADGNERSDSARIGEYTLKITQVEPELRSNIRLSLDAYKIGVTLSKTN